MNYLSIADYYNDKEDYVTARQYLQKLIELNEERNDKFGLAITYEYYGISYLEEGRIIIKLYFILKNHSIYLKN